MLEKVEALLGVEACDKQTLSPIRQILDMLGIALILIFGNVLAWIFSLVPIFGIVGLLVFGTVVPALLLGCEFFDCCLSLRGKPFLQKLRFFRDQATSVLGIGCISLIFLPIPILNAALFTLSIVGATLRLRTIEAKQKAHAVLGSDWEILLRNDTAMIYPAALSGDWNNPCHMALHRGQDKIVAFDSLGVRWESLNGLETWSQIQEASLSTLRSAKIGVCTP